MQYNKQNLKFSISPLHRIFQIHIIQYNLMLSKTAFLLFSAFSLASSQQISITSFLQQQNKNNLVKVEAPTIPQVVVGDEEDANQYTAEMRDGFLPCQGKENCGESRGFQSQKQFSDFVAQYIPGSADYSNTAIKTPIAVQPLIREVSILPEATSFRAATTSTSSVALSFQAADGASFAAAKSYIAPTAPTVAENRDFSGTNNQVEGVDQADLLKTDGTYIYTISNKQLSIILAYPANRASVVSTIDLNTLAAQALFIEGDFLSLFGTEYTAGRPVTFIRIYDVSNRARPFLSRTFKVEGRYINGRKTSNGFVYLITSHSIYSRALPWYDFGLGQKPIPYSSIFRYPGTFVSPALTSIVSFNLRTPTSSDRKVVSICGEFTSTMYMSERNIYLTSNTYKNGQTTTNIRKIFIWRKYIIPFADGIVKGSVNNQFSLDEYGPFLRVATTVNTAGRTQNSVTSLGFYLDKYGELNGIAPGESIFSARYVDRRLYLVTFRQVDPFFVISFANHKRPKILGQLKVPGFSRYLHPYDENTIIGFGRDADSSGRQLGLKISLFDVSDCSRPIQLCSKSLEQKYASSNAEWEHKAFLFSSQKNMMVIPTTMYSNDVKFNGALAFHIDKTRIDLQGAVDHIINTSDSFYDRNVERSLYIEQLLYTKSKCLLRINNIKNNYSDVKNIKIPCASNVIVAPPKLSPIIRPLPIQDPIIVNPIGPISKIPQITPIIYNQQLRNAV